MNFSIMSVARARRSGLAAEGTMTVIRDAFFRVGWLLPIVLPLAQAGGRALANVIAAVYLFWAIIAVSGVSVRVARSTLLLYLALPAAFLVSLVGAENVSGGFRDWFKFATHISVFYFTLVALQQPTAQPAALVRAWGLVAMLLVLLLYLMLPWQLMAVPFEPTQVLKEDNLPFLLPFGLFLLSRLKGRGPRWTAISLYTAAALIYVVLSQGRAALLAMAVGLLVYGLLAAQLRVRTAVGIMMALLLAGIGLGYATFFRGMEEAGSVTAAVDRFTSARTVIWRDALSTPPENLFTGVGIGNLDSHNPVLRIGEGSAVEHLHNVLLDVWYETGLLGLAALLAFIIHVLHRFARAWRALDRRERAFGGLTLAGVAAILSGALLSFSYGSWPFDVYMFMLLALLAHLAQSVSPVHRGRA